ncbi:hypothetical protein H7J73_13420 [Mycolicibacterium komossense]|uniref:Uncharacterized protein n=1 Tax=Mycolicibacterium komossense TaxID=1779 RepID=A0ABT3CC54_9MYCO|nr:hypothetical protein [Mycolicibacterium komossense]
MLDEVRKALDTGQPIELLGLVSMVIAATAPRQPVLLRPSEAQVPTGLDELISAFVEFQVLETTALLAVLRELVADDDLRDRCRREVDRRDDDLPRWLAELGKTGVDRAVRMSHILGDGDELLLGVRLADGQDLTCCVFIDHLSMSAVKDAFFVPEPIGSILAVAEAANTDPDTTFVGVELHEAHSSLAMALERHLPRVMQVESDTWPGSRALVQWVARLMPVARATSAAPHRNSAIEPDVSESFFASPDGVPFQELGHRTLLSHCIEQGTGDPLRWSAARLRLLLAGEDADNEAVELELQLNLPDLLRAFVPFAHATSGIRQELTEEAVAAIDDIADGYRAALLAAAERRDSVGVDDDSA